MRPPIWVVTALLYVAFAGCVATYLVDWAKP